MNRLLRMKDGTALDVLGLGVLGAILAVVALAAFLIVPLVSLYRHPPTRTAKALDQNKAVTAHEDALDRQVAMVDGRSFFFDPRPPDMKPTTEPARFYGGPSLVAFVNGTAWFSDGQKVSAKEPNAKTLKFISSNAPWAIRVGWDGGEFDVKLFDRTDIATLRDSAASSLSNSPFISNYRPPGAAAAAQSTPPADAPVPLSGKLLSDRPDAPLVVRFGPGPGGGGGDAPANPANGDQPPRPSQQPAPPSDPAPSGTPAPQTSPPPAPAPAPSPSEPPKDPEPSRSNQP